MIHYLLCVCGKHIYEILISFLLKEKKKKHWQQHSGICLFFRFEIFVPEFPNFCALMNVRVLVSCFLSPLECRSDKKKKVGNSSRRRKMWLPTWVAIDRPSFYPQVSPPCCPVLQPTECIVSLSLSLLPEAGCLYLCVYIVYISIFMIFWWWKSICVCMCVLSCRV